MLRKTLLLSCLVQSCFAWGYQTEYGADVNNSHWKHIGDRFSCKLSHSVPYFGEFIIERKAGRPAVSTLEARDYQVNTHKLVIREYYSPWQKKFATDILARMTVPKGQGPLVIGKQLTNKLMRSLYKGKMPVFQFFNQAKQLEQVLHLSSINYYPHFDKYSQCLSNLFPASIEEMQKSTVYFKSDSDILDNDAIDWLTNVAEFIKLFTKKPEEIQIDGYADSFGTHEHNYKLSIRRAENVRYFLLDQGLDFDLLQVKYHGERYPIAPNSNKKGREKNRRVSIVIKY